MKDKISNAVRRIKLAANINQNIIAGHSGGKDSVVIHHLADVAGVKLVTSVHTVKPVYHVDLAPEVLKTAMDPDTLIFLYEKVCPVRDITFLGPGKMVDFIKENNIHCQIDGSRISEFNREDKSSTFIKDGENVSRSEMTDYVTNGIFGLNMCYPIYDWTDDDVFHYLSTNMLEFSAEYIKNGEYEQYLERCSNTGAAH